MKQCLLLVSLVFFVLCAIGCTEDSPESGSDLPEGHCLSEAVSCDQPTEPACAFGELTTYESVGTCDEVSGDCEYEVSMQEACEHGCNRDRNACADPPEPVVCDDGLPQSLIRLTVPSESFALQSLNAQMSIKDDPDQAGIVLIQLCRLDRALTVFVGLRIVGGDPGRAEAFVSKDDLTPRPILFQYAGETSRTFDDGIVPEILADREFLLAVP